MTKYLIVNADDFGYSQGINRGIIAGHTQGIITSTSVMVDAIAANEAGQLVQEYPDLSVGLHFEVQSHDLDVNAELKRQLDLFVSLTGRQPDHIDMHKSSAPTTPEAASVAVRQYCQQHQIPTRRVTASYVGSFGIKSADASVDQLKRSLDEVTDTYTELMTHIGYSDDYLRHASSYSDAREIELASVCDPAIRQYLDKLHIKLINWRQIPADQLID